MVGWCEPLEVVFDTTPCRLLSGWQFQRDEDPAVTWDIHGTLMEHVVHTWCMHDTHGAYMAHKWGIHGAHTWYAHDTHGTYMAHAWGHTRHTHGTKRGPCPHHLIILTTCQFTILSKRLLLTEDSCLKIESLSSAFSFWH